MTTSKPEVVKYIVPKDEAWDVRTLVSPRLPSEQLMVLASDYDALQAECEKLRAAMIEAKSYIDHYMYGGSIYREPAAEAIAIIDAAMEGDKP